MASHTKESKPQISQSLPCFYFLNNYRGLAGDEMVVFKCVEMAGNKGIWTRDLKIRTNLHQTVITKSLKTLENKKLIKAVRPVKVYLPVLLVLFFRIQREKST